MDALEFASKLSEEETHPAVDRWAEQFQEFVARQTLYLARQFDRIPESMRQAYWDALLGTLECVPRDVYLEVTPELFDRLMRGAPVAAATVIKERVSTSNGRAT